MKKSRLLSAACKYLLIFPVLTNAAPVMGPTGNAYEFIFLPNISWSDASNAATASNYLGLSGHLATITSQVENDFLLGLVPQVNAAVWLGGFDASGDYFDPAKDAWSWITGESFGYSNWSPGKPIAPNENYLQFFGGSVSSVYGVAPGEWNNVVDAYSGTGPYVIRGYFVEYELSSVPIPPALWLFGSGLLGLIGVARKKST